MIYHINGAAPTWPDIYRMNLADLVTRSSYEPEVAHADADWGHEYHPQVSNDNQWMVYMASQGCHWDWNCNNEIFIHKIGTDANSRVRVTYDEAFDAFPSIYVGTPWTATAPAQLVLSPNKLTFFARNGVPPAARTVLAKSSADGNPSVSGVTVSASAGWLDAAVVGNRITVSVRPGQVFRGRCATTVSVAVPGLAGSPGTVQVVLDADDSFPPSPVLLDGGVIDAAGADDAPLGVDGGLLGLDAATGGGFDAPLCDTLVPTVDAGATLAVPPTQDGSDGGCGCSLGSATSAKSGLLAGLLGLLLVWRARRPRSGRR
jgi:MYXO-CTERM domain-containing protein